MSEDASAFKHIYSEVFKKDGDTNKLSPSMADKKIRCYVKESSPYFLVADNYFYIPAYFTKKAVDGFKSSMPNTNISDLQRQVIVIQDWSVELAKVNSADVFTSYANIELRLIVKSFKLLQGKESMNLSQVRQPSNIYRDSEIKNLIQAYVNKQQASAISSGVKGESLPDISGFKSNANVNQGVVKFASGDKFNYTFKTKASEIMDMRKLVKAEKGSSPTKASVTVKPKVKGGSKAIKKSP